MYRPCIAERVANETSRGRRAGEISFSGSVAPHARRIPVPRFNRQIRIPPIGDGLSSGLQHRFKSLFGQIVIDSFDGNTIHACADRLCASPDFAHRE